MWWAALILLVVGLVAYVITLSSRSASKVPTPEPSGRTSDKVPKLRGNGNFEAEVVGESFYSDTLKALLGSNAYSEEERDCDAVLFLEDNNPHDNQAVAVLIDGRKVGHLSRQLAREFREAMRRDGLGNLKQVAVAAKVYGGGEEGHFSVSLDIPHG